MKLTFNKVFFYLVFLVWSGFIIWNLITPPKVFSENENRYLAVIPKFSIDKLMNGSYMKGIDEYINDQFVMRDQWIRMKIIVERAMLKQDINSVYFAKDGYLIEKHDSKVVLEEQAEKNREYLIEFVQEHVARFGNDRVKVMLVPTASDILVDKLPPFANGYNQNAYMDEVLASVSNHIFLDIRDSFKMHKDEYIYYKTDHHWTTLGAYYAYEQWANEVGFEPLSEEKFDITLVSNQFYGTIHSKVNTNVKPDDIYLYQVKEDMDYHLIYNLNETTDSLYDYTNLEGKDKYSIFMRGNNAIVEVQTNLNNGRKLLVIKDSFAHSFVPFVVNHFEKTYMIDLRYYNGGIENFIEESEVTDILVLYNTIGFIKDINISKLVK